jgi:hypothetical protein
MKYTGVYRTTKLQWVCPHCDKFHETLDLGEMDYGAGELQCTGCRKISKGTLAGDTDEWKQAVIGKEKS